MLFRCPFCYFFKTGWGFGGQVSSGSEKVEKRKSDNQKKVFDIERISVFFDSLFLMICLKFLWTAFFPILVAEVSQMRAPRDDFSARFVEQLER